MEVRASALKLLAHVCLRSDTEHVLADTVIFDSIYLEGAGRYNSSNKALFVNRGFMILEKMLGVPSPSIGSRWIDNWSYLTARDSRFGGEGGGMTQDCPMLSRFECLQTITQNASLSQSRRQLRQLLLQPQPVCGRCGLRGPADGATGMGRSVSAAAPSLSERCDLLRRGRDSLL